MGNHIGQLHPHGRMVVTPRRPYYEIHTGELIPLLANKCDSTSHRIRNVQTGQKQREALCQIMLDVEKQIHIFNVEMVGPVHHSDQRKADVDEIHRLNTEVSRLSKENKSLKEDNESMQKLIRENARASQRIKSSQIGSVSAQASKSGSQQGTAMEKGNTDQSVKDMMSKLQQQADEINELMVKNESAQNYIKTLSEKNEKLEGESKTLLDEKEALAKRLSKMVSDRLVDDNPAIADLSDPNRPSKLGEFYSEMYDNEWTDAFEALTKSGYDDKEAIITLRLTLINVLEFCKSKSSNLIKKTEDAVNFLFEEYKDFNEKNSQKHLTLTRSQAEKWLKQVKDSSFDGKANDSVNLQERWRPKTGTPEQIKGKETVTAVKSDVIVKQLKVFRKEVAESIVPMVQKAYMSASWKSEYVLELKPFIKKCIFLGWMMVVQSPPMCLLTCKEGGSFDKSIFKEYMKSGPIVDYVVWPALYLHDDGPLVGKGVAEGKK